MASEAVKQDLLSRGNTINCWYKTTAEISMMQQQPPSSRSVSLSVTRQSPLVFFLLHATFSASLRWSDSSGSGSSLGNLVAWSIPSLFQVLVGRSLSE